MANMDRSDAERLKQLDAIEDKLKRQKALLKDIKESNMDAAEKEKAIEAQVVKINQSLKEQVVLKKEINKQSDREITLVTKLEDFQKKIGNIYKKGTPEIRKQMEAQGGIIDQSEIITNFAEKGKKLSGDQGDIYSEMAQLSMEIGEAGLDNLLQQKNIGKEEFKQIDLKDKQLKIQELENQLQNTNFDDAANGGDVAKAAAQDALDYVKQQYQSEKDMFDMRESQHAAQNDLLKEGNDLMGGMILKTTGFIKEFTAPFVGIYSTKEIIEGFSD